MNVALYGRPSRWAMTERGRRSLRQHDDGVEIGASAMHWDGEALTITIEEITAPLPSRLKGTVTVRPRAISTREFLLDTAGRHRWRPIAPLCDVTLRFERPDLSWRGTGYFDTNGGSEPLESAFRSWTWSRFDLGERARIFYDVVERDGTERCLSLAIDRSGGVQPAASRPFQTFGRGLWGLERSAPADAGAAVALLAALEDAPFYTRSNIRSRIDGVDALGVHESLSLSRLAALPVRLMMPFRMPRTIGG